MALLVGETVGSAVSGAPVWTALTAQAVQIALAVLAALAALVALIVQVNAAQEAMAGSVLGVVWSVEAGTSEETASALAEVTAAVLVAELLVIGVEEVEFLEIEVVVGVELKVAVVAVAPGEGIVAAAHEKCEEIAAAAVEVKVSAVVVVDAGTAAGEVEGMAAVEVGAAVAGG